MKIEFSSSEENKASFVMSGTSVAFANSLRRAMLNEVTAFAIEDVRIYDNTSALFDEILTHRLGLIPLVTDNENYVPRSRCSCNGAGCSLCTVTLTMSVEGPGVVMSGDLLSQDPVVRPVVDTIPVVKLEKNQKVVIEAKAIMDRGMEHAKWSAVNVCGYKNYPAIACDERCDGCGMCAEVCPKEILEVQDSRVSVKAGAEKDCSLCKLCEHACLNSGIGETPAIHISMDERRFLFTVEGSGALPVVGIIKQGLLFLKTQSDELHEALSEIRG